MTTSDADNPALTDTEVADSGEPSSDAPPSWIGSLIDGRYEVDGVLGRGGMGVVYRAREPILGREVALKTISGAWLDDDAFAERFHEEARALARIRHANVVQLYTFGLHQGAWFLAMELVGGTSLAHVIDLHRDRGVRVSPHNAVGLLSQVLAGAGAIHAAGLVHCDLKPSNIVVEHDSGRPVIVDFGVAAEARFERRRALGGSPGYMAPEHDHVSLPGPAIDIYALGCTAFELFTGALPYSAETVEDLLELHREAPVPRLSNLCPELEVFDGVVGRALAKRPEARFASGTEMREALDRAHRLWRDRLAAPTRSAAPSTDERAPCILVVDDDPGFRGAVARATRRVLDGPMRVLTASSGEEALRIALEQLPRLVLLDYMLPKLDGVATLSVLRSLPGGHDVRVIVISGTVEDVRWQFVALGVRHFLTKPIDLTDLSDMVSALVGEADG